MGDQEQREPLGKLCKRVYASACSQDWWQTAAEAVADEVIRRHYADLPPGDEGLVEAFAQATKVSGTVIPDGVAAIVEMLRQRGWLEPDDTEAEWGTWELRARSAETKVAELTRQLEAMKGNSEDLLKQYLEASHEADCLESLLSVVRGVTRKANRLNAPPPGQVIDAIDGILSASHIDPSDPPVEPKYTDEEIAKARREFMTRKRGWCSFSTMGEDGRKAEIESIAHIRPMFAAVGPSGGNLWKGWMVTTEADGVTTKHVVVNGQRYVPEPERTYTDEEVAEAFVEARHEIAPDVWCSWQCLMDHYKPQFVEAMHRVREKFAAVPTVSESFAAVADLEAKLKAVEGERDNWRSRAYDYAAGILRVRNEANAEYEKTKTREVSDG